MPLNSSFFRLSERYFAPHSASSGTEHIAPLLYSLVRMTRPRSIVEFGSGYTTLFLLQAIEDNTEDALREHAALIDKTKRLQVLETLRHLDMESPFEQWPAAVKTLLEQWAFGDGISCAKDPRFFLEAHRPHLYGFEAQDETHEYSSRVRQAVDEAGLAARFTQICGAPIHAARLPKHAFPIDFIWNDCDQYREFFQEFWPHLNPAGGIMLYHNVPSYAPFFDDIQWMKQQRQHEGDLEVMILEEPHKFNQNGCAILRRVSAYAPRFAMQHPAMVLRDLQLLMARAAD